MNTLRLLARSANGRPPKAPLRKKRLVGKVERGSVLFKRQTLPQAEPTAAERTAVMVIILLDKLLIEVMGCARTVLNLGMVSARLMAVRNRANGGTERRM
jgi:hypothetical protein